MPTNPEKVDELRESAQQLAKQALETAELGLRFVRTQFEAGGLNTPPMGEMSGNFQATAFNVENKAKEMFNLATHFMAELNEKWQPSTTASGAPGASGASGEAKPKPEKIDIDAE